MISLNYLMVLITCQTDIHDYIEKDLVEKTKTGENVPSPEVVEVVLV